MVDEPSDAATERGVYHLAIFSAHHVSARRIFVHVLALFSDITVFVKDLTNVLHDKSAFGDRFTSTQAPTLEACLYWVYVSVLVHLKPAIFACITDGANLRNTILVDTHV